MCAPLLSVDGCLRELEQSGADLIHIDVMDGSFVPNYTLGTNFVKELKSKTIIPLDIHLMIDDPEKKLEWFAFGEGDYVSVHYEASRHLNKALAAIRARGAKAMVALNPATPICVLEDIICDVDLVLLMSVNPGFGGQKFIPHTFEKVRALREMIDRKGSKALIQVDGGVGLDNWQQLRDAGADVLVAGSAVYGAEDPMAVCEIMSK